MASLLLSVGVPMISGGDEMGRTQQGNNNAYCQDNEIELDAAGIFRSSSSSSSRSRGGSCGSGGPSRC